MCKSRFVFCLVNQRGLNELSDIRVIKELAISMAKEVGVILIEAFGKDFEIKFKGKKDLVTEMDLKAEAIIINAVKERFPDHGILSEECDEIKCKGSNGERWIIDPIDGTTNYAHNLPHYCVSIAFENKDGVQVGVVFNPVLDELFTSVRGEGAYLNGKRIHVSESTEIEHSLIATDFPYDFLKNSEEVLELYYQFSLKGQSIRRLGSAALDFCYVAAGRIDGFWLVSLMPWDVAAAGLIAEEAGASITDFKGKPYTLHSCDGYVVSNSFIHKQMLEVLKEATKKK